jgi:hypothetical protein
MAARDKGEPKRVEVGFSGGQAILMRLSDSAYDDFRRALKDRGGWYEVDSADGLVAIDLAQVVFVKSDTPEHRVGFSGS